MTRRWITLANFTMKKNYKTTIVLGTAFAVIAAGIFSDSAFAVVRTNFCANLNQAVSVLDQGIITREGVLKTRQNERLQNLKNNRDLRDAKLAELKQGVMNSMSPVYAKIEALAKTDGQKTAVNNFKTAMENAVSARKNAVKTAALEYRQEIDRIIALRNSAIDNAVRNFKNSNQAAVKKAKTDCAAGVRPPIARTTFVSSIRTARSNLISNKQKIGIPSSLVKSASTEYKNTVAKANQDFKAASEKARLELRVAF